MITRRQMLLSSGAILLPLPSGYSASPTDILASGEKSSDARLGAARTLNSYVPFQVPENVEQWQARKRRLKEQLLVANGLWPMPVKTPLQPVVHGLIEKNGYTIEKVFFASMPGHYVSGNLYRPANSPGKKPGILFAHGHWNGGRFETADDNQVERDLKSRAEGSPESARYFMQALPASLAKLGFVVFQYDMVGYADSQAIPHRQGFLDAEAELRLQSFMGLQTWNSIRALDFLTSLPDVDDAKIGMTGASGGGTQTFILSAIDDRIAAAFPAVMVSTEMQGGCICESCSLLRLGTGNVEIAGLFAPKPMAMSCANDWTKNFLKEGYGLPELQRLYRLLGKPENISAKLWIEYPHNYNQPAREFMYSWFLKHLQGKEMVVQEPKFEPVVPANKLSVFDAEHPKPNDALSAGELRKRWTARDKEQLQKLLPNSAKEVPAYCQFIRSALRAIVGDELPKELAVRKGPVESKHDGITMHRAILGRKDEKDAVPFAGVFGPKFTGKQMLVWVHPKGKASLFEGEKLAAPVQQAVDAGVAVVAMDVLGVGELKLDKPYKVDDRFAGYTLGYNRALLANQVHDILTGISFARYFSMSERVSLAGWGELGPAAVLASVLASDVLERTAADLNQFDFAKIQSTSDPMLLPGGLKYGGLEGFLAACAPLPIMVYNGSGAMETAMKVYTAARASDRFVRQQKTPLAKSVVEWLTS